MKLSLSQNEEYLAIGSLDKLINLYKVKIIADLPRLDLYKQLKIRDDCQIMMKFIKNNRILVVGKQGSIQVINLNDSEELYHQQKGTDILCADISASHQHVIVCYNNCSIQIHSIQNQTAMNCLNLQQQVVKIKCNKQNDGIIVYLTESCDLMTADILHPQLEPREIETLDNVADFDFSDNDNYLVLVTVSQMIYLLDTKNYNKMKTIKFNCTNDIHMIKFSKDSKQLILLAENNIISWNDFKNDEQVEKFKIESGTFTDVDFINQNKQIVTGQDESVNIYQVDSKNILLAKTETEMIECIAKSYDDCLIAIGSHSTLMIYETEFIINYYKKEETCQIYPIMRKLVTNPVNCVVLSQHSSIPFCAYAQKNGLITIQDIYDESNMTRLQGHNKQIQSLCLSNKDRYLFTAGIEGDIIIYDMQNNQQISQINLNRKLMSMDFSQNGQYLILSGMFNFIILIDFYQMNQKLRISNDNMNYCCKDKEQHDRQDKSYEIENDNEFLRTLQQFENKFKNHSKGADIDRKYYIMNDHKSTYRQCLFSPNDKMIAALDSDNQVKLYNTNQQVFKEIHQDKLNIKCIKFTQDSKKLIIIGIEIYIYDIELDIKHKIMLEDEYKTITKNISSVVFLYQKYIVMAGVDSNLYIKGNTQNDYRDFQMVIDYFTQQVNDNFNFKIEDINDEMFQQIFHFKGHLEINFIVYVFLDFLNNSKDENQFLLKIETITSIFSYLREKQIFIHFSCKFYREFKLISFIKIFNLLDSKIQDQFIFYLVETNCNVDCEFCEDELQKIFLFTLQNNHKQAKKIFDKLLNQIPQIQLLNTNIEDKLTYFCSKYDYLRKFKEVINYNQQNELAQLQFIFYFINYNFKQKNYIFKDNSDKKLKMKQQEKYLNNDIIQLIARNFDSDSDIYESRVLYQIANHQWQTYGRQYYLKKLLWNFIQVVLIYFQIYFFVSSKIKKNTISTYKVIEDSLILVITISTTIYDQFCNIIDKYKVKQLKLITGKSTKYLSNNIFDGLYQQIQDNDSQQARFQNAIAKTVESLKIKAFQFQYDYGGLVRQMLINTLIIIVCGVDLYYQNECFDHNDKKCLDNTKLLFFMQYSYIVIVFYVSIKFVYMLRNFQPFQILIGVIGYIFKRIVYFMMIILIFVAIFTLVFYLQQINGFFYCKGNVTKPCAPTQFDKGDKGGLYKILRYTVLLVLGDYSDILKGDSYDDDFDADGNGFADDLYPQIQSYVLFASFIFGAVFLQIVFLNLLIAMINDFYQEFQGFQKKNYTFNLTNLMSKINFDLYRSNKLIEQYKYNSNFLFICINSDDKNSFEGNYENDKIQKIIDCQSQIKNILNKQRKEIDYNNQVSQQNHINSQHMNSCIKFLMNQNNISSQKHLSKISRNHSQEKNGNIYQSIHKNEMARNGGMTRQNSRSLMNSNIRRQSVSFNRASSFNYNMNNNNNNQQYHRKQSSDDLAGYKNFLVSQNQYSQQQKQYDHNQKHDQELQHVLQQLEDQKQLLNDRLEQFQSMIKKQCLQQQQQIQQQQEQIQQQLQCQENVQYQQQQMDQIYQQQLEEIRQQINEIEQKISQLLYLLQQ